MNRFSPFPNSQHAKQCRIVYTVAFGIQLRQHGSEILKADNYAFFLFKRGAAGVCVLDRWKFPPRLSFAKNSLSKIKRPLGLLAKCMCMSDWN